MIEKIAFILLILTMVTGFIKKRRLHEELTILTLFSLFLHILEKQSFSLQCFLIILFSILTFLFGVKSFKVKGKVKLHVLFSIILLILVVFHVFSLVFPIKPSITVNETSIKLPEPNLKGMMSLEEAIMKRRSIRDLKDESITLEELSQILWAAQGITSKDGKRTVPSAGMTYPLEVYILVRRVNGMNPGIYHYNPSYHDLNSIKVGNYSDELKQAAFNHVSISEGGITIAITADFSRTTSSFGERGERYVYLEAGHCAQNIYLQVTALNMGSVVVGSFNDQEVQKALSLPENHKPIYIIPIGRI